MFIDIELGLAGSFTNICLPLYSFEEELLPETGSILTASYISPKGCMGCSRWPLTFNSVTTVWLYLSLKSDDNMRRESQEMTQTCLSCCQLVNAALKAASLRHKAQIQLDLTHESCRSWMSPC